MLSGFLIVCSQSIAQNLACSPNGTLLIFSNYDGGELNINIDQNIPNIKIGVCTYEPVRINISGPFASNVSEVLYAGFNSTQNNNNCNLGNFPTAIFGVPLLNQTILTFPPVALNNPNGFNFGMVCGYSCDVNSYQGGCNTIDQIENYFTTQLGGTLYSLNAQYCCWLNTDTFEISELAGNCCNVSYSSLTLTSAVGTDNQTVCINNSIVNVTYSYSNAAPTIFGLPIGVAYTTSNGILTISGSPNTVGTFTYSISQPGNCGAVQNTNGTITVSNFITDTIVASACSIYTAPWGTLYNQTGTYTDTVDNNIDCDSIIQLNLTITGLPTVTASSVPASCGLPNGTATAAATGGSGNFSFAWSNGATGDTVTGLSSGNYTVTATDQNGCASSTQVTVLSEIPSGISITANDTCLENKIQFSIFPTTQVSNVTWNFDDLSSGTSNTSTALSPSHTFSESGTYTVFCIVNFSCGVDTLYETFTISDCNDIVDSCKLYTPNSFTPNFDGLNDSFNPSSNCSLENYELLVFNRWGEMIFKTSNQTEPWDGKWKGSDCSVGVYFYLLSYKLASKDLKELYGSVTLMR